MDANKIKDTIIRYRLWYKGVPPRRIKLQTEWAGSQHDVDASPIMCKPYVDGSTYGCELVYPFRTECRVRATNGVCEFIGDFSKEKEEMPIAFDKWDVPFLSFAPNHFGFTSSVDIKTEEGYGTMILPHPRYYTDRTGTVPLPVMGMLESDWWPRIFFVVFKAPLDGQEYIFRQGEPYAALLFLPKTVKYDIKKMTNTEINERALLDSNLAHNARYIATKRFIDSKNQPFDNKYKELSRIARTEGCDEVKKAIVRPETRRDQFKVNRKMIWKKGKNDNTQV